jgi:hypothetical protein
LNSAIFKYYQPKNNEKISLFFVLVLLVIAKTFAQSHAAPMPEIIEKYGRHAFLTDGRPYLMPGGQAHNASGWPGHDAGGLAGCCGYAFKHRGSDLVGFFIYKQLPRRYLIFISPRH